ncbi:MAG: disulfide bond formation protein B [Planctomycetia bacterium]|nr:disulfide bond formation protein B [Planctomycetia bacterium]
MVAPLPVSEPPAAAPPPLVERSALTWNLAALAAAIIAVAGSLWLSLGMDLKACPLCYYQRSFVMGAGAVLLMALLTEARQSASVSLMALPLAASGLSVAVWHVFLEATHKLECPAGLFGFGTAPQQSLAAQIVLFALLLLACVRRPAAILAVVLGALLAFACIKSVAPLPRPSPEEYQKPPTMCRPPMPQA